jgi:hypothetical protein
LRRVARRPPIRERAHLHEVVLHAPVADFEPDVV